MERLRVDMASAVVVDDESVFRRSVARILRDAGHRVEEAASGREAIDLAVHRRPDWLVVDWMLADSVHGLHVAAAAQAIRPDVAAVLVTSFPIADLKEAARDLGFNAILRKPVEGPALLDALRQPPPVRRQPPGFGAIELDADGRVRWSNPQGRRLLEAGGELPEAGPDAWVAAGSCEIRARGPLVLIKEEGAYCNDALVELVLGRREPGSGRWPRKGRVLVVDDQPLIRGIARSLLESAGATCYTAGTHEAALRYIAEDPGVEVVILDFEMPDGDVGTLVQQARALRPELVLIGNSGGNNRDGFRARGVDRYLPKPWRLTELIAVAS